MLGHILHAIYTGLIRSNVKEAIVCIHVRSNHNYMHLPNCYCHQYKNYITPEC